MRIIDLLNKIAKGEEVPKKIRIDHWCYKFEWVEHLKNYYDEDNDIDIMSALSMSEEELNYKVEIIEENQNIKEIEITRGDNCQRFIEYDDNTGHHKYTIRVLDEYFANKINLLIKEVNKLKNK